MKRLIGVPQLDALVMQGRTLRRPHDDYEYALLSAARAGELPERERHEIRAEAASDTAELYLLGSIGGWFGISAEEVIGDLRRISASKIKVFLNSKGGDVFDGLAIFNALRAHPAKVETIVLGLAASIASVIALAGDVSMYATSMLMIHEPHALTIGRAKEMRDMAALLDKTSGVLADVYQRRTKQEPETVRTWMHDERWFTAAEAKESGFVDVLLDGEPPVSEKPAPKAALTDPAPAAPAPAAPAPAAAPRLVPRRRELAARLVSINSHLALTGGR
jgi:ATP-dependent protease ClpP protease subunit